MKKVSGQHSYKSGKPSPVGLRRWRPHTEIAAFETLRLNALNAGQHIEIARHPLHEHLLLPRSMSKYVHWCRDRRSLRH